MNISETEAPIRVIAKTCGCRENNKRKVTYALVDSYHSLCLDKKDIIYAELEACEKLLKYTFDLSSCRQNPNKRLGPELLDSSIVNRNLSY